MTEAIPVAAARAARPGEVVGPRSLGVGRVGERAYQPIIFAGLAIAAAAVVLWLDRDMRPLHDEFWYLCGRSLTDVGSLFAPHNEHWVTLHAAAYLAIAGIFGTSSSLPFVAVLVALHVAVAGALWRLTGSMLAAAAMLFFGAGYENLLWGFQIGPVGALALGLWALVAVRAERPGLGAGLLVAAVATSGNGLFAIPALGAYLIASRRMRELAWLAIPVAAWLAWFLLERSAIDIRGSAPTMAGVSSFVTTGILATLAFGGGWLVAAGNAAAMAGAFPWRLTPLAWAGLTGLGVTFGALALVREGFSGPESSRYLYLAAPFLILAIAELAQTARRPLLARAVLASGVLVGATLLVANGLAWPTEVAAARANGVDVVPAGVCRS